MRFVVGQPPCREVVICRSTYLHISKCIDDDTGKRKGGGGGWNFRKIKCLSFLFLSCFFSKFLVFSCLSFFRGAIFRIYIIFFLVLVWKWLIGTLLSFFLYYVVRCSLYVCCMFFFSYIIFVLFPCLFFFFNRHLLDRAQPPIAWVLHNAEIFVCVNILVRVIG